MKGLGGILAIIGVVVIILAVLNNKALHLLAGVSHGSIYIAVVGAILLVVGAVMYMIPRKAAA